MFFALVVYPRSDDAGIPKTEAEAAGICSILNDRLQTTTTYIAGRTHTVADCALGMLVHRWFTVDINSPKRPAIKAYHLRLKQGPILGAGA